MLVQFCAPYGQDGDAESLDEDYRISVACLEDRYPSSELLGDGLLSAPLEGVWELRAFRDGEGNTGSLVRVRARIDGGQRGLRSSLGIGDFGRGGSVDTYQVDAKGELGEELELMVRSLYEAGAGYDEVSSHDFEVRARRAIHPRVRMDFFRRAAELEFAKGPLRDNERFAALLNECQLQREYVSSLAGLAHDSLVGVVPFYANALARLARWIAKSRK